MRTWTTTTDNWKDLNNRQLNWMGGVRSAWSQQRPDRIRESIGKYSRAHKRERWKTEKQTAKKLENRERERERETKSVQIYHGAFQTFSRGESSSRRTIQSLRLRARAWVSPSLSLNPKTHPIGGGAQKNPIKQNTCCLSLSLFLLWDSISPFSCDSCRR